MTNDFEPNEIMIRAVWPSRKYWRNGRLSTAALKDPKGLSVERTKDRTEEATIDHMKTYLGGRFVGFSAQACNDAEVYRRPKPNKGNEYHAEIHPSEEISFAHDADPTVDLSLRDEQALGLIDKAKYY